MSKKNEALENEALENEALENEALENEALENEALDNGVVTLADYANDNRPNKAHYVLYKADTNELYIKTGKVETAMKALCNILEESGGKGKGDKSMRINAKDSKHAWLIFNTLNDVDSVLRLTRVREPRPIIEEFNIFD